MTRAILLHNILTSRRLYDEVVREVTDAVAIDFRAHGERMQDVRDVTVATLAEDVLAFADREGLERFVLAGNSLGATVALLVAERAPQRVERLVLTGVNAERARVVDYLRYTAIAASVARTGPTRAFVGGSVRLLFARAFLAEHPAVKGEWQSHVGSYDARALAAVLRCWRDRPHLLRRAHKIGTPTTILVGAEDVSCPPKHARRLQAVMPNARLQVVSGAGHMLPLERPAAFIAALRDEPF